MRVRPARRLPLRLLVPLDETRCGWTRRGGRRAPGQVHLLGQVRVDHPLEAPTQPVEVGPAGLAVAPEQLLNASHHPVHVPDPLVVGPQCIPVQDLRGRGQQASIRTLPRGRPWPRPHCRHHRTRWVSAGPGPSPWCSNCRTRSWKSLTRAVTERAGVAASISIAGSAGRFSVDSLWMGCRLVAVIAASRREQRRRSCGAQRRQSDTPGGAMSTLR